MSVRPTLLDIPDELFVKILSSLDFLQLVRSQLVCKRFDHAVRSAGELQYIVELGVGGLTDGPPHHPFNTFERLNYLKSRSLEWRDPCVQEIAAVPPLAQAHSWKLRAATLVRVANRDPLLQSYFDVVDVVRLDPSSVEQSGQSYALDSQYTGFEFDPTQDLLVLFNRFPTLPCSSVSFSLLSLGAGTPHPGATNHPLVVPCLGKSVRGLTDSLSAIIWEEILVVQLFDGLTKFYFVNWRAGVIIANMVRKSAFARIHNLCRLEHTKFAFIEYDYHSWPQHYTLFIYFLDPRGSPSSTPEHLATFNFPTMSLRITPVTFIYSSFPPALFQYHHINQTRPNFVSRTSGIVQIRMMFTRSAPPFGFQVFVSPGILLRAGKGEGGKPSVHAWDEWGPPNTRWIKDPLSRLTPVFQPHGYRIGLADRILDFNPCEVGRDICRSSSANPKNLTSRTSQESDGVVHPRNMETPKSNIIREPTVISTSEVVRQDIYSSLPYRETSCLLGSMSQSTFGYTYEDLYFVEIHRPGTATIHICSI